MYAQLKQELYDQLNSDASIFEFIQDEVMDGMWYFEIDDPYKSWTSPKFWQIFGYTKEEIIAHKKTWFDFVYPEDLAFANKELAKHCADPNYKYNVVMRYTHKNGATVWVRSIGKALRDDTGKPIRMVGTHTDITQLKRAEQLLEESNLTAKIGYWELDFNTQKVKWSKVTKIIHQVDENYEPTVNTAITFYNEGYSKNSITQAVEQAISQGISYKLELEITTAKGKNCWISTTGQPELVDGKCVRLFGTIQDINEKKIAELALQKEREKLTNVLEGTNAGIWEWNVQTGETIYNERWANIVGYTLDELSPLSINTWANLAHPDDLAASNEKLQQCFNKEVEYYHCECRMKHKDGYWVWVLDRGKIVSWTDDGKPLMMFGTHTVISELKKATERTLLFIEQTPNAIAMFNTNMEYLAVSEKWKTDYKIEHLNLIGKSHYEIFPEIREEWKVIHQKCLAGATQKQEEDVFVRADGSVNWLKWEIKPWYIDNGQVGGIIMYTEDINERKDIQDKLRINEQAFRGNFENAAVGMAMLDLDGNIIKVNKTVCDIVGYTEEEIREKSLRGITHPDDLTENLTLLDELIAGKRNSYQMEKRYIGKNDKIIHAILAVSAVRDASDKIIYLVSQIVDITAQKTSEQKLKETLAHLQSILDASTEVVIMMSDTRGIITSINKGVENLLGYTPSEIIDKLPASTFHLHEELQQRSEELTAKFKRPVSVMEAFIAEIEPNKPATREWTLVRKNGTTFPAQLTLSEVRNNGEIVGYLGVAADISEIKKAEKEIQSLLDVSKSQNERLTNFAHIVSHNLRSHSGNIDMLITLLLDEKPELSNMPITDMLKNASTNLKETIANLTEVAAMNTSATGNNLTNINLHDCAVKAINNVYAIATSAQVEIVNNINPSHHIKGIAAYLDSILLNFITNGIKYSNPNNKPCKIILQSTQQNDYTVLEIIDNGLGIDLAKHGSKLFGMYKTFHGNKDARGVGLFITKNQVESIGGKIEVISTVGVGSTFKITFKA